MFSCQWNEFRSQRYTYTSFVILCLRNSSLIEHRTVVNEQIIPFSGNSWWPKHFHQLISIKIPLNRLIEWFLVEFGFIRTTTLRERTRILPYADHFIYRFLKLSLLPITCHKNFNLSEMKNKMNIEQLKGSVFLNCWRKLLSDMKIDKKLSKIESDNRLKYVIKSIIRNIFDLEFSQLRFYLWHI